MSTFKTGLSWPNRVYEQVLSGGSWEANFPLTNLQDDRLTTVARTTAGTTATVNAVGQTRTTRVYAISNHNLTNTATWRIRVYSDNGTTLVYDSGTINAWDVTADEAAIYPRLSWHVADADYSTQQVTIDVTDSANGDGYLQFGGLFIGSLWQAETNIDLGYQQGLRTLTKTEVALDGVTEYHDVKPVRRTAQMVFSYLTREESYLELEAMRRTLGTDGELMFFKDLEDNSTARATTFLARLDRLDPLIHRLAIYQSSALAIVEKRA